MFAISITGTGIFDPIPITRDPFVCVPLLLALEGLLIAVFARKSSVYLSRFVPFWIGVSTLTFALLVLSIVLLEKSIGYIPSILAAETVIVVLEALCISFALSKPIFAKNPRVAPGFGRALVYSLIINLVSLVGSLSVLVLP